MNKKPKLLDIVTRLEAFTLFYKSDARKLGVKNLQQFRDLTVSGEMMRPEFERERYQERLLHADSAQLALLDLQDFVRELEDHRGDY